ncbi:MAG: SDR family NAD(P)-dependent oxidoreductase [Treponema sp.]|nr:SDR family NAD(P)-dependent oxidoreductase [Treponema sp.]
MYKKVVIITGASSGIGYESAKLLAQSGYKVYGGARRVDRMEDLKQYGVVPLSLDVTDQASAEAAVKTVMDAEGRIDVLFNNAGYGSYGAIETVPLEEAQKQIDVNVMGVARMSQLVAPIMRAQKSGRIIITSSVGGRVTSYLGGWYHVSKWAVESLGNSLRQDLKPFGIYVSILEPSGVKTEWGAITADHLEEAGKGTAYEAISKQVADYYRQMYNGEPGMMMNTQENLAKLVKKIVEADKPKSRYQDSMTGKMSILMGRMMSDKFMDNMMMNTVVKK